MDNDKKEFLGRKIKYFRKKRGLTQNELAEHVDLSEKHISKIEAGIHQPSIEAFFKIIQVLSIGLGEFGLIEETETNLTKKQLFQCINDSTDKELELFLPIIITLKENLKKNGFVK